MGQPIELGLRDTVEALYEHTKGVAIVAAGDEGADEIRSRIGDCLARRTEGLPAWWDGENRRTSPYRVYPSIDQVHVYVIWLDVVDSDMAPAVQATYPTAKPFKAHPNFENGDSIILQVIRPIWYSPKMLERNRRKNLAPKFSTPPNLNDLIPFVRHKMRTMCLEWLWIKVKEESPVWYDEGTLRTTMQNGGFMSVAHRTHKTGFVLKNDGFVGQAIYQGDREAVANAHVWLQAAALWGLGAGTTWGWSTVWETVCTLGAIDLGEEMFA